MNKNLRYGLWSVFTGVVLQLVGLSWDALLHHFDSDLAANEGVFSLTNPSHLLVMVGLGLTVAGVIGGLIGSAEGSEAGSRRLVVPVGGSLVLVLLVGLTTGIGLATGGISGSHDHGLGGQQNAAAMTPLTNHPVLSSLLAIVRESGTEQALTRLEELAASDQTVLAEAHNLAHAIGRFSFSHYRNAQEAFARCRETFQSGCYHGVLEEYFLSQPRVGRRQVAGLCDVDIQATASGFVRFQCVHGLGHALTMHFNHNIMKALEFCDFLPSQWDQVSCYGGVFMENIIFYQQSQQGGHQHGGRQKTFLKASDPLYPCNAVKHRYREQCYLMQTSAMLMFNGYDFAKAAQTCLTAPTEFIPACFQSLGRDVSGFTLRDSDRSLELCQLSPVAYRSYCFVGAVKNFIDINWKMDQAFAFCQRVPPDSKTDCYTAIGEQVANLALDRPGKVQECGKAEAQYIAACLGGARLADWR